MAKWMPEGAQVVSPTPQKWTPEGAQVVQSAGVEPTEMAPPRDRPPRKQYPWDPDIQPPVPAPNPNASIPNLNEWLANLPHNPDIFERIAQEGPELGGGTAGAMTGAVITSPLGPIGMAGGALLGSLIGGMSGKGYQELAQGVNENTLPNMLAAGDRQIQNEAIGQATGGLIGLVGRGGLLAAKMIPGVEELSQRLSDAVRRIPMNGLPENLQKRAQAGKTFIPLDQATDSALAKTLTGLARGGYATSQSLRDISILNPLAHRQMSKEAADMLWDEAGGRLTPQQTADLFHSLLTGDANAAKQAFADTVTRGIVPPADSAIYRGVKETVPERFAAWRSVGSDKYANVDQLVKERFKDVEKPEVVTFTTSQGQTMSVPTGRMVSSADVVDLSGMKGLAPEFQQLAQDMQGFGSAPKLTGIANLMANTADTTSFRGAHTLQSALGEAEWNLKQDVGSLNPRASRMFAQAREQVKKAMEDASRQQGAPEVWNAYQDATNFWRANSAVYDNPVVLEVMARANKNKANLAQFAFDRRSPDEINALHAALGDDLFNQMTQKWLSDAVRKSMDNPRSVGMALREQLDNQGMESLTAMYGSGQSRDLFTMAQGFADKGAKGFESQMAQSALRAAAKDPQTFTREIFRPGNTEYVQQAKDLLGTDGFNAMRAHWISGALDENDIGNSLSRFLKEAGDPLLEASFSPAHLRNIREIARAGEILSKPVGQSMLAPLLEAGAVATMIRHPSKLVQTGGAATLGTVLTLGSLLGNEKTSYWIARGVKDPAQIQRYAPRIMAEVARWGPQLAGASFGESGGQASANSPVRELGGYHGQGFGAGGMRGY